MPHFSNTLQPWVRALLEGTGSGTVASLVTTAVLARRGATERGDASGPVNGPSQWLWGKRASYERGFSLRHTVAGYAVHHVTSIFWATFFQRTISRRSGHTPALAVVAAAGATSAIACIVDYRLVPERLTPGFERQLSRRSLALTYFAFGLALAGTALLMRKVR